ncbi:YfiT family bacillithiol transferase [Aquimarina sp. 2201CG5-10]|uniref:YfiT family bacillithiol transferase n=1 Tax=Aquimarina callyspongiae TaxID=3098150 RepID=UPI002AB3FBFA|nr:putative metal-dependent hydrolase [Aquimarina sp. 2201CG5-10]MDY8137830.1 putative metal-dependent hydrolase [Aquimarina sp. 2201CG5-10]
MMDLRYPIGKFNAPQTITENHVQTWIEEIASLPERITELVSGFTDEQLETPYRLGGWTARQVIHHVGDSHHNSYIRFKWALTEDTPVIKVYHEDRWAELFDTKSAPIDLSLEYLKVLHAKLVYLLKGLSQDDLKKEFIHPEGNVTVSLAENIGKYAWHGNHHLAHLKIVAEATK